MSKDIGSKTRQSVLWTIFFHSVEYTLNFGSGVILARLLFPADFGLMGLASIAIHFARRLANFGFGSVLIWLKDVKQEHYDTVYIINLTLMGLVCGLLFLSAPFYAAFFNSDKLSLVLRIIAFDFILRAFASVPHAILKRHMNFRLLGLAETIGKVSTIISTIILALAGAGVWSLVVGTLFGSFCERTAVIRFARRYANWRPRLKFRLWALKESFPFGTWIYANTFVGWATDNVDHFFIGKFLGATQLGFYDRAFRLMSFPRKQVVRTINAALFSGYSRIQDDNERLAKAMLRVVTYLSFISYPLMIWLFFVAPSLIPVVYGEKWTPTVLPLQIMCIGGLLDSFRLIFQPLLRAKGLVAHHTRRDFVSLLILTAAVAFTVRWGITGISCGIAAVSLIHLALMLQITARHFPFTIRDFISAQLSAMVYGSIQVAALLILQTSTRSLFPNSSVYMLISVTALSLISVVGAHLIIRFRDVDSVFSELLNELKRFTRVLPVFNQLSIFQK